MSTDTHPGSKVLTVVPVGTQAPSWADEDTVSEDNNGEWSGGWSHYIVTTAGTIEVTQFVHGLAGEDWKVSPAHVEMGDWSFDSYLDLDECLAYAYGLRRATELIREADAAALALGASW